MKEKTSTGSSLKKNIIYNVCYQILILILPLITAPYISRVLGADNIGTYSYIQAFANYFVLFAMLGVNNYGNREISRVRDNKEKLSITFCEIYSFQLIMAIVVSVIYLVYVSIFCKSNKIIYILQFIYVISSGLDINWFCFGIEKFKICIVRNTLIKMATTMAIFICVKKSTDLNIYTGIMVIGTFVSQIAVWPFIIREIKIIKPKISGIIKRIKPNLILFIPVVAISLYNIMDKIMLGTFASKTEVGYYDYALKIVEVPNVIALALGTVMMPRISNLIANGKNENGNDLLDKSIKFIGFMSIGLAAILAGISHSFTLWFYGIDFYRCSKYTH